MIFEESKMFAFSFKLQTFELKISIPAATKEEAMKVLREHFAKYIQDINEELNKNQHAPKI